MTFFLIILCIILMVYTFREARTIWYTENKFAGIVVGHSVGVPGTHILAIESLDYF